MIKAGLMGCGKAGQAVAQVLCNDPRLDLCWIARRTASPPAEPLPDSPIPIIGHHAVIFSLPYQTLRIIHNSIERRDFGTGAAFALTEPAVCSKGLYTFDDLLMRKMCSRLAQA